MKTLTLILTVLLTAWITTVLILICLSASSEAARTCRASGGHWHTPSGTCTWDTP